MPSMPPHDTGGGATTVLVSNERVVASASSALPDIVRFSEIADPAWKATVDGKRA